MQNLYDFLRRIKRYAELTHVEGIYDPTNKIKITEQEYDWLNQFLQAPDHELHFKAKKVGTSEEGEPMYAQDYAIAGDMVDIFSLLTEAMFQNANFASLVKSAAKFFDEHIPNCPDCKEALLELDPFRTNWNFSPHKPIK